MRKQRLTLAATLLGAGLAVASPASVQPGEKPAPGSTEAELWYQFDQAEKQIKAAPVLVRDAELNTYVRDVACKVTREHCRDLRVYIINAPVFNAQMAPNGVMLVFTGALLRMQDEAELALVLGHEFAHYRQRHSLQFWEKAKRTSALTATFGALTYAGGVGIIGLGGQMLGLAGLAGFSRDMERESDAIGVETALALGYDPQGGARVWTRLLAEEKASREPKPWPAFASHPRTAERLKDVTQAATAAKPGEARTEAARYRQAMRPWLEAWLEAELSRRMYDTSIQVIGDLRQVADPEAAGLYAFYLGEAYRRRNKNDDRIRARGLYSEAIALASAPAAAWREHGLALRTEGRQAEAGAALARYLEMQPQASDRAFIQKYIHELGTNP